jgi:hypothetical protein
MSSFFVPRAPTIPASANFRDLMVSRLEAITGGGGGGGNDNQPYKQQGQKLVGTGYTSGSDSPIPYNIRQGFSVALSDNGSTLAVGGPYDDANQMIGKLIGATWIFTTSDGGVTWSQQGEKLVGAGGTGMLQSQGTSVALSVDGSVLAVGGPYDDSNVGATWIFTRNGDGEFIQQAKLVGTGGTGSQFQGIAVALSADGLTLAVGGSSDNNEVGATWIFTSDGTDWSEQIKLVGTGTSPGYAEQQGWGVSLSADGLTLAVGAPGGSAGATWIFTKDEELGTWSQQGGPLQSNNATSFSKQGTAVALSDDGLILAVGGPGNDTGTGATWVWTRTGTSWSENCFLVGTQADNKARQGQSVSLSGDGSVLVVEGPANDIVIGATWIFRRITDLDPRVGSSWYQEGEKLVCTGYRKIAGQDTDISRQLQAVSLSGDGSILVVGNQADSAALGATWIFTAQEQ